MSASVSAPDDHALAARFAAVRGRIAGAVEQAGRSSEAVRLIAVSKTWPAGTVRAAQGLGQLAFGENYLQEAQDKQAALADLPGLEWHYIGPIQSNKTRGIAVGFDWVHGVASARVARRLAEQRPAECAPLQVLIQVNVDGEAGKSGVAPADLPALAEVVCGLPRLRLAGLMTIPAAVADPQAQRQPFAMLRQLRDGLAQHVGQPLPELSMGMSGDLEAAIHEGATLVRVGTALFGPRRPGPASSASVSSIHSGQKQ